jgi:hypothetical protein
MALEKKTWREAATPPAMFRRTGLVIGAAAGNYPSGV